jgi:hypothetical protein
MGPSGRKRHRFRLGGFKMKFSTRMKGRIPEKVVEYLLAEPVVDTGGLQRSLDDHFESIDRAQVLTSAEKRGTNLLGGEPPLDKTTCEVLVAQSLLQPTSFYVMKCCKKGSNNMQLLLKLPVILSNNDKKHLEILVDTGAEANLVRIGLLPEHLFFSAPRILKLLTANGQRLAGGARIVETTLGFTPEKKGVRQKEKWYCNAEFYEADIQVDAILSYPWMVKNKIGVLPIEGLWLLTSRTLFYYMAWMTTKRKLPIAPEKATASMSSPKVRQVKYGPWMLHRVHSQKNRRKNSGNARKKYWKR